MRKVLERQTLSMYFLGVSVQVLCSDSGRPAKEGTQARRLLVTAGTKKRNQAEKCIRIKRREDYAARNV